MNISKARCPDCRKPMRLTQATCGDCELTLEGDFDLSPLGQLPEQDQVFVVAFLRHHGSIRQMERVFDISYPTVKNRLKAIVAQLDRSFAAPASNAKILDRLAGGEITVEEALEQMGEP